MIKPIGLNNWPLHLFIRSLLFSVNYIKKRLQKNINTILTMFNCCPKKKHFPLNFLEREQTAHGNAGGGKGIHVYYSYCWIAPCSMLDACKPIARKNEWCPQPSVRYGSLNIVQKARNKFKIVTVVPTFDLLEKWNATEIRAKCACSLYQCLYRWCRSRMWIRRGM